MSVKNNQSLWKIWTRKKCSEWEKWLMGVIGAIIVATVIFLGSLAKNLFFPQTAPNTKKVESSNGQWETVGLWTYDPIDGQYVPQGFILREEKGALWDAHLELKLHASLPDRARSLWPVMINRKLRKVCVAVQGYPTYSGHIDLPGDADDGVYIFKECHATP
ncbi:hypothetical protein [Aliikangiella coralliicola]|uniref:Uncharacterized protein n=1 Tax=Aliikangiella coralliicola TaxID=2592383 RepID=A0A545UE55_9GAMM|nr:hypothetical protein [Aliikangiella coralliicola]TQV87741.1 hypothetical protein FLL46_10165 [Aliikangiella coralliicola]